ncbi:hypothetical protein [Paenibacillus taiwanensis]|nr:hypothetical protein [Paenibacillus taiwanensis]
MKKLVTTVLFAAIVYLFRPLQHLKMKSRFLKQEVPLGVGVKNVDTIQM